MTEAKRRASPQRFILLYALAWAGGSIAYTPFLSILLPMRVATLAGVNGGRPRFAADPVGVAGTATAGVTKARLVCR